MSALENISDLNSVDGLQEEIGLVPQQFDLQEGQEENEEEELLDFSLLGENIQSKILKKFDFETFAAFNGVSSLTRDLCHGNPSFSYPLEAERINFVVGLKTYTLQAANKGQARLVAQTCAFPVNEVNYEALIKNRSVVRLLILRGSLQTMTVGKLDKLLQAVTTEKLSFEGKMKENLLKCRGLHKLKKVMVSGIMECDNEILLELHPQGPEVLKFERVSFTPHGIANFIKQFIEEKRSLEVLQFPYNWENLDRLQEEMASGFLTSSLCPNYSGRIVSEFMVDFNSRRAPNFANDLEGIRFQKAGGNRAVEVVITKERYILFFFRQ